jgi:hypothetical protein
VTVSEALNIAQYRYPLDLAARVEFLWERADGEQDQTSREAWIEALAITRNGEVLR